MKMKGTHLTLEDRKIIQHDLENGMNRAQIAKELGKSPSTISKEIKSAYAINAPIIQSAFLTNTTTGLSKHMRNI